MRRGSGAPPPPPPSKQVRRTLPVQGVTLHALIDSCHSGTVMNLPYNAVLEEGRWTGWEDEYPGEAWKHVRAASPDMGSHAVHEVLEWPDVNPVESIAGLGRPSAGHRGWSACGAVQRCTARPDSNRPG
jgi:hypothetical protein